MSHVLSFDALKTIIENINQIPEVSVIEKNETEIKSCIWKCVKKNESGNNVLSIINMGKTNATLNIQLKNESNVTIYYDSLNVIAIDAQPILKP